MDSVPISTKRAKWSLKQWLDPQRWKQILVGIQHMPFRFGLSKVIPWLPFKMERFLVLSYSYKEVLLHNNKKKCYQVVRLQILCDPSQRVTFKKNSYRLIGHGSFLSKEQKTVITFFIFSSTTSCFQVFAISAASFVSCKTFSTCCDC